MITMVDLAILPVGAVEQHGPHLPITTDARIADAAAHALAANLDDAVVLPVLPYGASGEHQDFSGTCSAGTPALTVMLVELGRSISQWADRLLIINAHGGNIQALGDAVSLLRTEGRNTAWVACRTAIDPTDTHAGHAETSLMLHLDPDAVRMDRAEAGCGQPLPEILPRLRASGMAAVTANGVLGDPTSATATAGATLFTDLVDDARRRALRWQPNDSGQL